MISMIRTLAVCMGLLLGGLLLGAEGNQPSYPFFEYAVARAHEVKPHRPSIPLQGVSSGFHQIRVTLTVSPVGDVIDAVPGNDPELIKFWPQLQDEVGRWKFTPFEENGKAISATVEEYIDLVPPERFPVRHLPAPALRPDSKVTITLLRTVCYGRCPGYKVTISTAGIIFDGGSFVVAAGKHTDRVDAAAVRKLARQFLDADFYSMDSSYKARVTDNPTYIVSIAIDGRLKKVEDYVGSWEGMPAVITELEDAVDALARSDRWIEGSEGLVEALKAERFNFQSPQAQDMMKEAAHRGKTATVKEFLQAGVPPDPFASQ